MTFTSRDMDFHRRRLCPGPVEPRKRKRSSSHLKDAHSPTKTSHLSSDELKSDDDDRTKLKSRVLRAKKAKKTNQKGAENVEPPTQETSPMQVEETKKPEKELQFFPEVGEKVSENEHSADAVTFLTVWGARQVAETRASVAQDAKHQVETIAEKEEVRIGPEVMENEPCVDTVTFLTAWEARQAAEARASKVQDAKNHAKNMSEEEVKTERELKGVKEYEPCVDTVTFLTVWEARQAAEARASKAQDVKNQSKTISEKAEDKSEPEPGTSRENLTEKKQIPSSADRKSPPVLSIPETGAIPPSVDPFLSVLEGQSVVNQPFKVEAQEEDIPWKIEEDKVILHTLQVERYCEETFVKISEELPSRSVEDIKTRFQALLNILYKMKAESNE